MHDINYYELFDNELFTKVKPDCWDQICVGIVWQSGGEEGTRGTQRKNDLAIMYVVLWKLGNENVKPVIKTETTTK